MFVPQLTLIAMEAARPLIAVGKISVSNNHDTAKEKRKIRLRLKRRNTRPQSPIIVSDPHFFLHIQAQVEKEMNFLILMHHNVCQMDI